MRLAHLILALLILAPPVRAGLLDAGFDAEFNVYMAGIYAGISERHVTVTGDTLTYTARSEPRGMARWFTKDIVSEKSTMRLTGDDVQPLEYRYDQTGKDEVHEKVLFDWESKTLTITKNGKTYPITDNTYDMLSFQIAMMRKLARLPERFTFHVADHHDLHTYTATVTGKEVITTEYRAEMETVRVDSVNEKENLKFTFWCAPALDYLPVRIRIVRMDLDMGSTTELKRLRIRGEGRGTGGEVNASP